MKGLAARIQALEEALARRLRARPRCALVIVHDGSPGPTEDELAQACKDRVPRIEVWFVGRDGQRLHEERCH